MPVCELGPTPVLPLREMFAPPARLIAFLSAGAMWRDACRWKGHDSTYYATIERPGIRGVLIRCHEPGNPLGSELTGGSHSATRTNIFGRSDRSVPFGNGAGRE